MRPALSNNQVGPLYGASAGADGGAVRPLVQTMPTRRWRDLFATVRLFTSIAALCLLIVGAYAFLGFN